MSYQVIARKYRPQRFADVVGQEHVTQTLSNAIQQKRIAHAYLFVGPRGTGKTTIARIFAKCLNATDGPKVDFDDNDPRCQEISDGRSLDVMEIDGASNRGIEEIRSLRDAVKFAPATSRYKIYIIDEVHMLTKEAFNALLKTLEEPPEHVKFMFATTEPEKVLPTILSRCQRYDLRRIPVALIVRHLGQIAALEKVHIEEAALHAIARGAEGCMRDAESTLDQLISFCGERIVEADVLSMFGLAARGQVQALASALLAKDKEAVLRGLDELARNGKDLGRLLSDLLNHFRNLLLFLVVKGDMSLLEVNEAEAAVLQEQARTVTTENLTRVMEVLTDHEGRLREAVSKKIFLEITLLKAIEALGAVSLDAVIKQLALLRAGEDDAGEESTPAAKASASVTASSSASSRVQHPVAKPFSMATAPVSSSASEMNETAVAPANHPDYGSRKAVVESVITAASQQGLAQMDPAPQADPEELWVKVIEAVGRVSQFTRTYLLQAHPVSLTSKLFTIGFDPEFADHIELVDNLKNRTLIQTKIKELGYGEVQVKFIKAEAVNRPAPASPPPSATLPSAAQIEPKPKSASTAAPSASKAAKAPAAPRDKEDFKNDPLIKQALEIFKGQIVEIRG